MSRSVADVERSMDRHRAELARAIADFRTGADQAVDAVKEIADIESHVETVKQRAEQMVGEAREKAEATVDGLVDAHAGEVTVMVAAAGFVAGGGASGAVRLPFKVVGVATGRRSRSRGRVAHMRADRYSRQMGRALAAVAAGDRQLRRRRRSLLGGPVRRLAMLGLAGGGVAALVNDENLRKNVLAQGERVLDRIEAAVG